MEVVRSCLCEIYFEDRIDSTSRWLLLCEGVGEIEDSTITLRFLSSAIE